MLSMRLVGMYFEQNPETIDRFAENIQNNENSDKKSMNVEKIFVAAKDGIGRDERKPRCFNPSKCYSTILLILMWLNLARLLTIFTPADGGSPPRIIGKFAGLNFAAMSTLMFTCYYHACSSGKLQCTLRELQTYDFGTVHLRTAVWVRVILAWLMTFLNTAFVAYALLISEGHVNDSLLTPLTTQITTFNADLLFPLRMVVAFWYLYMNAAWAFASAATFALCGAFAQLFRIFNRNFKAAIDDNGKFGDQFDAHRLKHQRICKMVNAADKYLAVFFATSLLTNIAAIITILYVSIWYPSSDPVSIGTFIFWILGSTIILATTVVGAMMVNCQVDMRLSITFYLCKHTMQFLVTIRVTVKT